MKLPNQFEHIFNKLLVTVIKRITNIHKNQAQLTLTVESTLRYKRKIFYFQIQTRLPAPISTRT